MIQFHLTRDIAISLKNTIVVDKVWTALIRLNLPSDIQRQILASLECNILPFLPNPILFTDFIHTQIGSQNAMNALLALGGMAYLMLNCGADYPPFYIRLYSLFADQHTSQSYHTRLLQYTDQYLSSPMLPRSIAASFAKKAAQNALKNGYCWACTDEQKGGKTKNIEIQDGQSSFIMRTDAYRSDHDKFNPNETNPQNTGAENSFLWEIATLTNHYNTQIAKMAHSFVNFETDLSHWDITKFTNQSSKQLFLSALETPMLTGKAARRTRRLGIENNIVGSEAVVEHLPSTENRIRDEYEYSKCIRQIKQFN
ncbi:MAG: putative Nuclear complex protein 4 [Streblomastix strix]|uniref:Putative Nuclear complex protein 4 n=1 Tax=Streblomastix strix TaxID=222440 RepID=A0A5J4X3D6_9EUKA|nr:MAG: putative Nuclear complex protein 4 [Streblomastix strix]